MSKPKKNKKINNKKQVKKKANYLGYPKCVHLLEVLKKGKEGRKKRRRG